MPMTSTHFYSVALLVLIVSRKRTPADEPSPASDVGSLERKIKTEPVDSSSYPSSTPKKGKKIITTAIEVSSDEEEIATPTPKAKHTSANRNTTSTPSKVKLCVLVHFISSLHFIFFSPVSRSYHEDQQELAGGDSEKRSSKKLYITSFLHLRSIYSYIFFSNPGLPTVTSDDDLPLAVNMNSKSLPVEADQADHPSSSSLKYYLLFTSHLFTQILYL